MSRIEWNKFFAWLCAAFPQWKSDQVVSAAWFDELSRVTSNIEAVKNAVREITIKTNSPFPPGLFQIVARLNECDKNDVSSVEAWQIARGAARGLSDCKNLASTNQAISETVRMLGGLDEIGYCPHDKIHFLEKRFCEIYQAISIRGINSSVKQLVAQKNSPKLVGDILKDQSGSIKIN